MLQIQKLQHDRSSLAEFVSLVDTVFLLGKSRCGSLVSRFPGVFLPENLSNLYAAVLDRGVVGTLATKDVVVRQGQIRTIVRMVGLVAVKNEHRGRGIGRRLLRAAMDDLRRKERLSVLWTTLPAFYAAEGWVSSDDGVVGEWQRSGVCNDFSNALPAIECVDTMEAIRQTWLTDLTTREVIDYRKVPPAVDSVWCVVAGNLREPQAYALVGERGNTGIIYELIGDQRHFEELWSRVCRRFSAVFVNDCAGSASYQWCLQHCDMTWRRQELGMWFRVGGEIGDRRQLPYVPFFDRI